ncbi:hypothetical protein [Lacticaseibacillus hulanensis]|uniref:hypothetical protein n=1 Tax=Lacticaseibacillus hulanensis TaxID=2493111 RepID=UPI000FD92D90|nr:hypothetical protein [Lacticaseibacillus hulanensis]
MAVKYEDSSPIPDEVTPTRDNIDQLADTVATWLRTKMYGVDVREALARWVEYTQAIMTLYDGDISAFEGDVKTLMGNVTLRQGDVEVRQTTLESQFLNVVAHATTDSELILARDSSLYGAFRTLGLRLDNIERILGSAVPSGFTVTIKHGLGRNPTVTAVYYEWSLGMEPAGLGTGPDGSFGGTGTTTLQATVSYPDANTVQIELPAAFALSGDVYYQSADKRWYIIDGYKVLRFDLGLTTQDNPDTSGGSTSGVPDTGTTVPDDGGTTTDPGTDTGGDTDTGGSTTNPDTGGTTDPTDEVPATPTNLTAIQLDATTERLDWDD